LVSRNKKKGFGVGFAPRGRGKFGEKIRQVKGGGG